MIQDYDSLHNSKTKAQRQRIENRNFLSAMAFVVVWNILLALGGGFVGLPVPVYPDAFSTIDFWAGNMLMAVAHLLVSSLVTPRLGALAEPHGKHHSGL